MPGRVGNAPIVTDTENAQDASQKARIFISYSRKDMAFADRLEAALKVRGFEPLIDRTEIYAFEDWWKRIEALISHADTVVFALSPDAVASKVAQREVAYAASINKRFAPIVCRRVDDDATPEALRRLNFIFFDDPARFEASADRLAEALQTDIGWIRQHTEYGEAARRWTAGGRPGGLLLRSPVLEDAEHWIASRPRGAPEPTADTQEFVAESRRGATRRRNILTGSLAAGLLVALALAGLAYWQRNVALTNLHAGTNALSVLTGVIDKRILPRARVTEVTELLAAAADAVKQFPNETSNDPGVALELARLKLISADLEKLRMLGNAPEILKNATSAAAALAVIVKANNDLGAQYELAHSKILIGQVLTDNEPAKALPVFEQSIDTLTTLIKENPNDVAQPDWRLELSIAEEYLGDLLLTKFNETERAKRNYDAARDELETLQRTHPQISELDRDIAWAVNKQADIKLRNRDNFGALETFKDARDRLKKIEQSGHLWDDPNWVYTLVIIDNNIGLLQNDMNDPAGAIDTLKEAESHVDELVHRHDPNNIWWRGTLGWTLDNEGWIVFLSAGEAPDRLELARQILTRASQIRNDLNSEAQQRSTAPLAIDADSNSVNPLWQSDASFTAANLDAVIARVMDLAGDHCTAARKFADAAKINGETVLRDPEAQALRTMQFLDWSANAYRAASDTVDAFLELNEAVDAAKQYLPTTKHQKLKDQLTAVQKELADIGATPSGPQCPALASLPQ
jgi:tetratricopeptide (TPR) repeat protein